MILAGFERIYPAHLSGRFPPPRRAWRAANCRHRRGSFDGARPDRRAEAAAKNEKPRHLESGASILMDDPSPDPGPGLVSALSI
jgi:hypothetical protein